MYGSPYAGKTTYVASVATRNDIVVDLERIHAAICICGQYDKPDATKRIAFNIRDYLLDEIRTATPRRKWQDAYIIGSYPDRIDRDNFVREYNAELVHIDTPQDDSAFAIVSFLFWSLFIASSVYLFKTFSRKSQKLGVCAKCPRLGVF